MGWIVCWIGWLDCLFGWLDCLVGLVATQKKKKSTKETNNAKKKMLLPSTFQVFFKFTHGLGFTRGYRILSG